MNNKRGFTLIELMIVVVIIGILAALAIPRFNQVTKRSKEAEAPPILRQLSTLQERHRQAEGVYASTLAALEGGASNYADGKYYSYQLTGGGATFVACAIPLDASLNLQSFRVDPSGSVGPGTC